MVAGLDRYRFSVVQLHHSTRNLHLLWGSGFEIRPLSLSKGKQEAHATSLLPSLLRIAAVSLGSDCNRCLFAENGNTHTDILLLGMDNLRPSVSDTPFSRTEKVVAATVNYGDFGSSDGDVCLSFLFLVVLYNQSDRDRCLCQDGHVWSRSTGNVRLCGLQVEFLHYDINCGYAVGDTVFGWFRLN